MRQSGILQSFIYLLGSLPVADCIDLTSSFYSFLSYHIEDPNLSSFLSPSFMIALLQTSLYHQSLMSFSLFLFLKCLSRCMFSFIYSFIHSFIRSFVHSFIRSFTHKNHSFTGSIEVLNVHSQQLVATMFKVLAIFSSSSWQDRCIQQDVFVIFKGLKAYGSTFSSILLL